MSTHLVQAQIEDYCRRKLAPAELLTVSDHLGGCELCRRRLERAVGDDEAFLALHSQLIDEAPDQVPATAASGHLPYERMSEYVEGAMAGEELQSIRDHLSVCGECALAVADLQTFSRQVGTDLDREHHPMPARASTEGWWRRSIALATIRLPRNRVLTAASLLAAVILMWGGWATWRKAHEIEPTPAAVGIPPALVPMPAPAAPVIARLHDAGGLVTLDSGGNLSGVDNLPPAFRLIVRQGLTDQRLEKPPILSAMNRPGGSLLGGGGSAAEFMPSEPVGKVVFSDRPVFRWLRLKGAAAYIVEIYDDKFNLVIASPRLAGDSWVVTQPLPRGGTYSWQVTAFVDGKGIKTPRPPAPQAEFCILDQTRADEISRARRDYDAAHLLLGMLYARAGLLDESERELQALQSGNPDSAIVRNLLSSLRAMRR